MSLSERNSATAVGNLFATVEGEFCHCLREIIATAMGNLFAIVEGEFCHCPRELSAAVSGRWLPLSTARFVVPLC